MGWDLSSFAFDGAGENSPSYTADESNPTHLQFKDDGTAFYIGGLINRRLRQYNMSVEWSPKTASSTADKTATEMNTLLGTSGQFFSSYEIENAGAKCFVSNYLTPRIYELTFGTAWDPTTLSYPGNSFQVTQGSSPLRTMRVEDNGLRAYAIMGNNFIYQYDFGTAYDITTLSYSGKSYQFNSPTTPNPIDLRWRPDGTEFFTLYFSTTTMRRYKCSTAWDISTATASPFLVYTFTVEGSSGLAFDFKCDGSKGWIIGTQFELLFQHSTGTAEEEFCGGGEPPVIIPVQAQGELDIMLDDRQIIVAQDDRNIKALLDDRSVIVAQDSRSIILLDDRTAVVK